MRAFFAIICLVSFTLLGCTSKRNDSQDPPVAVLPVDSVPDTSFMKPMEPEIEIRFVALPSGLPLYNVPKEMKAGFIRKLPYSTQLRLTGKQEALDSSASYTYQGISGWYRQVHTEKDSGYVFAPFLSSIPMPDLAEDNRFKVLERYADTLNAHGLKLKWEAPVENADGGRRFALEIPAQSIQEAFLIARVAFGIPSEYRFPKQATTKLSSPDNPSKSAQEGPYDYVTQTFELEKGPDGQPEALTYIDDSEVGGRKVKITPCEIGWRIEEDGWAH